MASGFDGLTNTYARFSGGQVDLANVTLPINIKSTDTVIINAQSDISVFAVNAGNGLITFPTSSGPNTDYDISSAFTSDVSSFYFGSAGNWNFSTISVNGKLLVDPSVTPPGETQVTGQPLIASADDVEFLDGNTLGVNGVSGTWFPGLNAQGAEVTAYAPSPESIVFTSMNAGTTPFTGTDATLASRTWTLEKGNSVTGPWTEVGTYVDFAASASQDGATPWDNPDLEPNKFYQVKVKYESNNAESVESTFNTFKTGDV